MSGRKHDESRPKGLGGSARRAAASDDPTTLIKKKRSRRAAAAEDDARFATYIAKAHKRLHGGERTVSSGALCTLDLMTEHVIGAVVANARRVMRYTKTSTLNPKAAEASAGLALTGALRERALEASASAAAAFAAAV